MALVLLLVSLFITDTSSAHIPQYVCKATPAAAIGSHYKTSIKHQNFECGVNFQTLNVRGRVLDVDCKTPVRNVEMQVWQADEKGNYDLTTCAGIVTVDSDGFYNFSTVRPGNHQVKNGDLRPANIHFVLRSPTHEMLVTQLYFADDPYLGDQDPCRHCNSGDLRLQVTPVTKTSRFPLVNVLNYDFFLKPLMNRNNYRERHRRSWQHFEHGSLPKRSMDEIDFEWPSYSQNVHHPMARNSKYWARFDHPSKKRSWWNINPYAFHKKVRNSQILHPLLSPKRRTSDRKSLTDKRSWDTINPEFLNGKRGWGEFKPEMWKEKKSWGSFEHDLNAKKKSWGEFEPGEKKSWGEFEPGKKRSWGYFEPGQKKSWGEFEPDKKRSWGYFEPGQKRSWGEFEPGKKRSWGEFEPGKKRSWGYFEPGQKRSWGEFEPGKKRELDHDQKRSWGRFDPNRKRSWADYEPNMKRSWGQFEADKKSWGQFDPKSMMNKKSWGHFDPDKKRSWGNFEPDALKKKKSWGHFESDQKRSWGHFDLVTLNKKSWGQFEPDLKRSGDMKHPMVAWKRKNNEPVVSRKKSWGNFDHDAWSKKASPYYNVNPQRGGWKHSEEKLSDKSDFDVDVKQVDVQDDISQEKKDSESEIEKKFQENELRKILYEKKSWGQF